MTTTGIIFATMREAEPLLRSAGAEKLADDPFPAWRFTADGDPVVVIVCGMGKAAAARGTDHLLATHDVVAVINAGICGCIAGSAEVGQVFRIQEVRDGDLPDAEVYRCDARRWNHLPAARLVSCDSPVFDPQRRQQLAGSGELIDMEGAAVADACTRRSAPCCLIKGVSDMADEGGKDAIQRNIDSVSGAVADVLLQGLAPSAWAANSTEQARAADRAEPDGHAADTDGLPAKLMQFTKIEHTVFSLPLVFAGAWLGAGRRVPPLSVLGLIVAASVGARMLGMSMNRILDRKLDAQNPRTAGRELPAGRLSVRTAALVALAGGAVYVLACILLGPLVAMLSPIPLVALMSYSLLKRFTPLCHFGIGLCLGLAPLAAFVAAAGRLDLTSDILLLALYAFCWMGGFDIIYSLQDIDSDRQTGVRSIPAALGSRRAQGVAMGVHAVALASCAALLRITGGGALAAAALVIAAGAYVCAYLPMIPLPARFFPMSAIAGIAGALVPMLSSG